MKLMFVIFDKKAEIFKSLFLADNEVSAIRNTVNASIQPGTTLADYPDDFELRQIGTIDQRTCLVTLLDVPRHLGTVGTLVTASKLVPQTQKMELPPQ